MALHGFSGALAQVGLTLDDTKLVDVDGAGHEDRSDGLAAQWDPELAALAAGRVDAVYVKGAVGVEAGEAAGARVLVDLDLLADQRLRVNNGTPRPITVHQRLLDERPDLVTRFLAVLLRAADWSADNPSEVARILSGETGAGSAGVRGAYRGDYHRHLHPDLSEERLALLDDQQAFLAAHDFTVGPIDVTAWADPAPLAAARALADGASVA
jgi:ABC-type nitrate/sulfonate/bicarbonate transport system substrate-binding protein